MAVIYTIYNLFCDNLIRDYGALAGIKGIQMRLPRKDSIPLDSSKVPSRHRNAECCETRARSLQTWCFLIDFGARLHRSGLTMSASE